MNSVARASPSADAFLNAINYQSDEAQYQALMTSGVTVAQQYNLRPGLALSAAQMAQLTSDIVWLVEREVTLADGTVQKVLVPQVYVAVQPGDIKADGSLMAGQSINLNLTGDLSNSGTIAGRNIVSLTANNVHNLLGRIQGQNVTVAAQTDLNNTGGQIIAQDSLTASAGRDLNVTSTSQSNLNTAGVGAYQRTSLDRIAGLYVTAPSGTLVASAGRDINLLAAQLLNNAPTAAGQPAGSTTLTAGRDIHLGAINQREQADATFDERNYIRFGQSADLGVTIAGQGNVTLLAGNNLMLNSVEI
ncbi:MAG: hypothetical protein H0W47_12405 [Polaromonas sp.]|uniref:hypothetical protein n=1 Tax=Polaromonas sp. TaxID=1869339 RepID=UPI0017E564E8|nr:hypothetical protein [Polaromonas sp.]MBA3594581.1 hypothetical protein [Polaromonas sp.]